MKALALQLVELAAALFPPLAELIGNALDGSDDPLADEVRAILPARNEIHDAVAELQRRRRG